MCRGGLTYFYSCRLRLNLTLLVPLQCRFVLLRLLRRFSDIIRSLLSIQGNIARLEARLAKGKSTKEIGDGRYGKTYPMEVFFFRNMIHNIITIFFHVSFTVLQVV